MMFIPSLGFLNLPLKPKKIRFELAPLSSIISINMSKRAGIISFLCISNPKAFTKKNNKKILKIWPTHIFQGQDYFSIFFKINRLDQRPHYTPGC